MAGRYMFATQKVQQNCPIAVDDTLWNDSACSNTEYYPEL